MTQSDMILRYMREYGAITAWEAVREFGCFRLGARIYDLKQAGYPIRTEMETRKNRFGKNVSFAKYSIRKENTQ